MPVSDLSDDDLVERSRGGDTRAYGELWVRHSAAAHAVARAHSSLDPDDLVAEAFTRVLAAIKRGGGPSMGFRPYLLTAVRNVAAEWGARQQRTDTVDLEDAAIAVSLDAEHVAVTALENGATATAFRSLPTRWQAALWYSEIDGLKPRQFAPLLGLAPNAASALVVRARRGFRDAWISAQLLSAGSQECRDTLALLGTHTRSALSRRDSRKVDEHLGSCRGCALAWAEAREVSSRLALVLVPLVAGIPAAASYGAWVQSGGAQAASVIVAAGPAGAGFGAGTDDSGAARLPGPRVRSRSWSVAAGVAAALVIVGVGTAFAVAGAGAPPVGVPDAAATVAPAADPAPVAESEAAGPVTESTSSPSPEPAPTPRPPTPPRQRDSRTIEQAPPQSDRVLSPDAAPTPGGSSPPSPSPTLSASPTASPSPTPGPVAPPAPTMEVDDSAGTTVYPRIAGGDAHPGATIEIVDAGGIVWATATAADTGAWEVTDLSGSACTVNAAGYLPAGTHALAARQIVDGAASATSSPTTVTVAPAPVIESPADGQEVRKEGFPLIVSGAPNSDVQRIKLPDASPCRPTPMGLDATGRYSGQFTVPEEGDFTIGVRYLDAATGRWGPATFVRLTAR